MFGSRYLIGCLLGHRRRIAPIVFTSEHKDGAFLGIDAADSGTAVPAPEVEVKISVEDTIGLGGVEMPDQLAIDKGRGGGHHL